MLARRSRQFDARPTSRVANDTGRLADAAVQAASLGIVHTLDETSFVVAVLEEALTKLAVAPSARRAQVLLALAVARSHNRTLGDAHDMAVEALEISQLLNDSEISFRALVAVAATDDDPATLPTRRHKLCSALELAARSDRSDWRRIVLPQAARVEAQCGELEAALALFDELRVSSIQHGDIAGQHHAVMAAMLRATSRGDYGEGVLAADEMKRMGEEALLDPATVTLMHHGQLSVLRFLFERPSHMPATIDIWPLPTMRALALGASAAEVGRSHGAKAGHAVLDSIAPQELHDLPRDFYWLPMVSTVAAGCHAERGRCACKRVVHKRNPVSRCLCPRPRVHLSWIDGTSPRPSRRRCRRRRGGTRAPHCSDRRASQARVRALDRQKSTGTREPAAVARATTKALPRAADDRPRVVRHGEVATYRAQIVDILWRRAAAYVPYPDGWPLTDPARNAPMSVTGWLTMERDHTGTGNPAAVCSGAWLGGVS